MNERAEANLNDGDNVKNLILSLISVIVLIFFGFKIFNNMAKLFFNYYGEIFKIHEKNKSDDDNNYLRDEVEFKNKSNEILKNINSIKLQQKKEFSDLREYKKKYDLDNINYSEVNNKILSKKYDDYEYNNKPNIINFILDIFKPTKK
jgi:hypothetical protein|tara:strand:- start:27 stop:470 length:444 start_codon:yes stop_codon:yes gene_type:complete